MKTALAAGILSSRRAIARCLFGQPGKTLGCKGWTFVANADNCPALRLDEFTAVSEKPAIRTNHLWMLDKPQRLGRVKLVKPVYPSTTK